MEKILVTGGAGYIGSVAVKRLVEEGYEVCVVDNLSKGKKELVDQNAKFLEGDVLDKSFLEKIYSDFKFDAVMHFAALKNAGKSMGFPEVYSANILGVISILNLMCKHNIKKIIFSSSAAVYGEPLNRVIDESHPTNPINFYGFTKLEAERIIDWYAKLKKISYVSLRYFNVAGDGNLGYIDPEAENIFSILAEIAFKKRDKLQVFGKDYDTYDGTCIRDYVHVIDIVDAHISALNLNENHFINLGTSKGCSVLELIKLFEEVSGRIIPFEIVERREGDPDYLVASYQKAKELLNWQPRFEIKEMIRSTLEAYNKKFN